MGAASSKSPKAQAETLVSRTLQQNKVVIFSKTRCGYCTAAKRTLAQESRRLLRDGCSLPAPAVVELDDGSVAPHVATEVQNVLRSMTGAHTVPRVFIEGVFVGGAEEVVQYAQTGGLRLALMKAGRCEVQ